MPPQHLFIPISSKGNVVLYIADCGGNYESHLQHHCRQTKRGLKDDKGIRSETGRKRRKGKSGAKKVKTGAASREG